MWATTRQIVPDPWTDKQESSAGDNRVLDLEPNFNEIWELFRLPDMSCPATIKCVYAKISLLLSSVFNYIHKTEYLALMYCCKHAIQSRRSVLTPHLSLSVRWFLDEQEVSANQVVVATRRRWHDDGPPLKLIEPGARKTSIGKTIDLFIAEPGKLTHWLRFMMPAP